METNCKNCAKELNYKHVISADKQMIKLSFLCDNCQTTTTIDSEVKLNIREKQEPKKSCFNCKNKDLCKHYEDIFNRFEVIGFMNDTASFITDLGNLIAKHCKKFNKFQDIEKPGIAENQDVCKWEVLDDSTANEKTKMLKPGCWGKTTECNIDDLKNANCPACGKKIEVAE